MAVSKLELNNFMVFNKLDIDLNAKINIVIGENGLGKTNLLKTIYAIIEIAKSKSSWRSGSIGKYFSTGFKKNKEFRKKEGKDLYVKIVDDFSECEDLGHFTDDEIKNNIKYQVCAPSVIQNAVYIPVTEMLSHARGLVAFNQKYDLPFDQTQIDILINAELPEIRELPEWQNELLLEIAKQINGTVEYINDTFYVRKNDGRMVEFSLEAEGFRKLGLLWKLIKNGRFCERNPILLWDEPEANINPELLPILVNILLKMADNGIQIFLATHSYNLVKNFEVLRCDIEDVTFYNLYRNGDGVECSSSHHFGKLGSNSIEEADDKLFDAIMEKGLS